MENPQKIASELLKPKQYPEKWKEY